MDVALSRWCAAGTASCTRSVSTPRRGQAHRAAGSRHALRHHLCFREVQAAMLGRVSPAASRGQISRT